MPYIDTGQVSLHYDEAGQGGVPVLLLHELGGSGESWWRALPLFAQSRRTLAVDLRCAGRSEKPPGSFELADAADDLARMLDMLALPTVDVVGSALGSLAGAVLAARHPTRVRRLVMCAVSDDLGGETATYLAERSSRVRQIGMRGVADASLKNAFPDAHADARAAYRPIYLANDPDGYAELSLALTRLRMGETGWGAIQVPTLVASGAHDFIWPPPHGERVAAMVPGAQFTVLSDAGHFPHMQTPEALVSMATAFLDAGDP